MPYKLPDLPSPRATQCELADYLEITCLLDITNKSSLVTATRKITPTLDENDPGGIPSEDDEIIVEIEDALNVIQDRESWCNNKYPFDIVRGNSLKTKRDILTDADYIYFFLLLATRLNMTDDKEQGGINGTLLFEELCEIIAKEYFGGRSKALLLGTAAGASFDEKVKKLIELIKQGEGQRKRLDARGKTKDGGIDIVVVSAFSDERIGKLVGFGQCKTGTSWQGEISLLQPRTFVNDHFLDTNNLDPVAMFFIAEEPLVEFTTHAGHTDVFFTRCRIMDFLPDIIAENVINKIRTWVDSAIKSLRTKPVHLPRKKKGSN
ncbi:MAG: hypothetical protein EOP47_13120 [Sphingobacteriaceae bacterium]|nr:MAG: hypothetical protein EOP47_13120 [Sphingobacteriaceae bacterium]